MVSILKEIIKRRCFKLITRATSKEKLLKALKTCDQEIADIAISAFIEKIDNVNDLMEVIFDGGEEYSRYVRLMAGRTMLKILASQSAILLAPEGTEWLSPITGRVGYAKVIVTCLPELKAEASEVVNQFYPHEKKAYFGYCEESDNGKI